MAKLTKAKTRRRLEEASAKVAKVWMADFIGTVPLSSRDLSDLLKCRETLNRIAKKLK